MLAWGDNTVGYFCGQRRHIISPIQLPKESRILKDIRFLAVGDHQCCILNKNGSVTVISNEDSLDANSNAPKKIKAFDNIKIVDVFAGGSHMFAVSDKGIVYGRGVYRLGDNTSNTAVPKILWKHKCDAKKVVQISCGLQHTLVLLQDGSVYSMGDNTYGQLGIDSYEPKLEPIEVSSLHGLPIAQVVAAGWHSFCVTVSGKVFSWGRNDCGQLGLGDQENRKVPCPLLMLHPHAVKFIAAGEFHSAALTLEGKVFTFGSSSMGQLGHGTISSYEVIPRKVDELDGSVVTQVACGKLHTVAYVPKSNNVFVCGSGEKGQLGQGEILECLTVPTMINGPWRQHGSSQCNVKEIFACGDQNYVTLSPGCEESTIDFCYPPACRCIAKINKSFAIRVSQISSKKRIPVNTMQQLECIFSSQSCLNASFLETKPEAASSPSRDHHSTSDMYHGLDMTDARLRFQQIMSCKVKEVFYAIQSCLSDRLLPSLTPNPPDIEALRVYILLPELIILYDPEQRESLAFLFVEKLLQLADNSMQILEQWYQSLEPDYFETPIKMCKECVVTTVKKYHHSDLKSTKVHLLLKFMEKLDGLNSSAPTSIVDFRTFYIPELTDRKFLEQDYEGWSGNKDFNFCQYPFLYNSEAKTHLLQIESESQQKKASDMVTNFPFIAVRRENLVEDGIIAIRDISAPNLKLPFMVNFTGEAGYCGAVPKEFFKLMIRDMLDSEYGLFRRSEDSELLWFSDHREGCDENRYYIFGILCGLAIYNSMIIDMNFPLALYKKLLGVKPNFSDLGELEPEVAAVIQRVLDFVEGDGRTVEKMGLKFTVPRNGEELIENGEDTPITSRNRRQYADAYVDYEFNKSVKSKFDSFKTGFFRVCDGQVMKLFKPEELREMVVGNQKYNWEELEKNTKYEGSFHRNHRVIVWFWNVFHSLTSTEKTSFLCFFTGSNKVPITGLKMLIRPKYNFGSNEPDEDFLPVVISCHDILELPLYTHKTVLETKLKLAIAANLGFHR